MVEGIDIDTQVVAERFSKAARTYDAWAEPQRRVANRLCSFLPQRATRIADLGCGTGIMSSLLREKYPTAYITGVDPAAGMIDEYLTRFANDEKTFGIVASAEEFCETAHFDLVVSTNSFQWFRNKKLALANIKQSLTSSGQFLVATPLSRTLMELYESYLSATGTPIRYAELFTENDYASLFLDAGLTTKRSVVEEFQMTVPTPMDIIRFIQEIGGAPTKLRKESLIHNEQMHKLVEYYTQHFSLPDGVCVTYQYLYGLFS